jgi:hypothetical protein
MQQHPSRIRFLITLMFSLPNIVLADPLSLLNSQVDAFNQRDIKRLVDNVSEDFKYFFITADELVLESKGKLAFQSGMEQYYAARKTKIHSVVEHYTIDGNKISFKEVVSHLNKQGKQVKSSALGVYEIRNEKITRAWYFVD